jgi:hypothetical protein
MVKNQSIIMQITDFGCVFSRHKQRLYPCILQTLQVPACVDPGQLDVMISHNENLTEFGAMGGVLHATNLNCACILYCKLCRYLLVLTLGSLTLGCFTYDQLVMGSILTWPYTVRVISMAKDIHKFRQKQLAEEQRSQQ